jgi:hypothetical protein
MARRRSGIEQVRYGMYRGQRFLGDVEAASRGPVPLGRRLARRSLTRTLFRMLRQAGK